MLDITRTKETEREAREYATILATAQRIAGIGTYVFDDPEDRMVYVSEEYARIHGRAVDTLTGSLESSMDQVHPDDEKRVIDLHQHSMEHGESIDLEYRIIRPDGAIRHVREVAEVMQSDDGVSGRTIGTILDLTDVRETQAQLEEQRAFLATAQNIAGLGTFVFDDAANLMLLVSEEYAEIHGTSPEELMGSMAETLRLVHPDDIERVMALHSESMENAASFDMEYKLLRPDGEVRFVRSVGDVLPNPSGRGTRTIGAVLDLTDVRRAQAELEEQRAFLATRPADRGRGNLCLR